MPGWAIDLTLKVARAAERMDVPVVTWRLRHRNPRRRAWGRGKIIVPPATHSSGRCYPARIVITAGRSLKDQRLVLLHELAHWLAPTGEHHSESFWERAWALYRLYGVDLAYARKREGDYRKLALKVGA